MRLAIAKRSCDCYSEHASFGVEATTDEVASVGLHLPRSFVCEATANYLSVSLKKEKPRVPGTLDRQVLSAV